MLETLKSIILDFQESKPETGVPRHLKIKEIPGKATICIGVRRSGKSTYLFQIMKRLFEKGVNPENILYMNFFDDRLHNLRRQGPGMIMEAYYSIYPEKKNSETVYCFFDEIQTVNNWEPFIDRVMRTEKCKVYITGSSANLLSKEIATQMRGRALSWEIFPFSFGEFLDYKQINIPDKISTKKRLIIQKAFEEYWETGGFPEVAGLDPYLRVKIHQEYFSTILFRDLVERYDIAHPRAILDLAHKLINNAASLYSINSMAGYLKSLGHKAPKSAISNYFDWFEDAYFLFTVRIFDASYARSKTNPKKIYCIDHALVNSVASGILPNTGHLLENLVFTALRRITADIYYCKTKAGREVDFIALLNDRSRMLVQVCESLSDPKTGKREIDALVEAMKEYGLNKGIIVTKNEKEIIKINNKIIEIIPIWQFLLNLSDS